MRKFQNDLQKRIKRGMLLLFTVLISALLLGGCGQSASDAKSAISKLKETREKEEEAEKAAKKEKEKNQADVKEAKEKTAAEKTAKEDPEDPKGGESGTDASEESADEIPDEASEPAGEISGGDSGNLPAAEDTPANTDPLPGAGQNYVVPYAPCTFSKIGQPFDSFHVSGGAYDSAAVLADMYGKYGLNGRVPAECGAIDNNGYMSRIGVSNNRIIFEIQDSWMNAQSALPALLTGTDPLIVYGVDSGGNVVELQAIWRGNNGYFVAFLEAKHYPNGTYKDEVLKYSISTVDLNYVARIPAEVLIANGGF